MSFGTVVLSNEEFILNEMSIDVNEIIPTYFFTRFKVFSTLNEIL